MDKIALVTGSSRGIGRAVARRLAAEGYAVCVNYRVRQDCAMSLVSEITAAGGRAMAVQADVAHRVQVNEMVRRVEGEFGPVSLLVNNAGVAGQALFQDITDALWHRYFSVNVDGAFHAIQAVLPHMLHEHAGCIVNVSSIWGLRGASCEVTYSATKGALIALTRSLASELAPTGIRVNCVAPGVIKTDMLDALPPEVLPQLAQETPLGRLGTPEDIAAAVSFLADERASFITGGQQQRLRRQPAPVQGQGDILWLDDRAVQRRQRPLHAQHRPGRQAGQRKAAPGRQAASHHLPRPQPRAGGLLGHQHRAAQGRPSQRRQPCRAAAVQHRLVRRADLRRQPPPVSAAAEKRHVAHVSSPPA